ncbi:hybrid sensor histidine kinase/response regulator [Roseateles sp. PN1]|uniref:hybrid sensor histidine kinase/response regulator n=1 Tax=Roseateles sp. PN1 TaxID=3137372 RepID=UPI003138D435
MSNTSQSRPQPEPRDMRDAQDSEFPADLSPLAWVQEELRRSLESVHKSLRRLLRDGDGRMTGYSALGADSQPLPALQAAAAQLHQVAGVLDLVGLPAGAIVLRAAEQAVADLAQHPANIELARVEVIERADFALLSLVSRMLGAGAPSAAISSLSLFPSYRDLQALNGAERVHPADLWQFEWQWRDLPVDGKVPVQALETVRPAFESTLLKQMREPHAVAARAYAAKLSDLCAGLVGGLQHAPKTKTLWQLAAAMFEAQSLGLLPLDSFVKRLGSRLLSQLRVVGLGDAGDLDAKQRLAQDLLFFCAQSGSLSSPAEAPRLAAVREAYGLANQPLGDYEDESLGRIDPAWVSQAKRRVSAAKESWGTVAEGETHRMPVLDEQFASLAESLHRLFPSGAVLGEMLQRAVVSTVRSAKAPPPAVAMELATSLLYVEAALDEAVFDQPEQADRVKRLAARIAAVGRGEAPEPLEGWMEDLYRRVSDRQTLGSVVHELRSSLAEVERQADEYFRDPSQRERLIPVPGQLSSMRGVLTVLGLDQAALACVRMRDEVDRLANTEVDVERAAPRELFDRLANNLGALGFMIDMLGVQPALAKRMFVFDESTGRLSSLMGRSGDAHAAPPAPIMPNLPPLPPALVEAAQRPAEDTRLLPAHDPEMREIFLEEAAEVLGNAREALASLRADSESTPQLTVMRRAFHTLKGSSRMVGLEQFGEGAWSCEQLFNARLAEATPKADAALLEFSEEALDYLGRWCEQIASGQTPTLTPEPLREKADALRLRPLAAVPAAAPAPAPVPVPAPEVHVAEVQAEPAAAAAPELASELAPAESVQEPELTVEAVPASEAQPEPMPELSFVTLPEVDALPVMLAPVPPEAPVVPELAGFEPTTFNEFAPTEVSELLDLPAQPAAAVEASQPEEFLLPEIEAIEGLDDASLPAAEPALAADEQLSPSHTEGEVASESDSDLPALPADVVAAVEPQTPEQDLPFVLEFNSLRADLPAASTEEFELPEFELKLDLGEEAALPVAEAGALNDDELIAALAQIHREAVPEYAAPLADTELLLPPDLADSEPAEAQAETETETETPELVAEEVESVGPAEAVELIEPAEPIDLPQHQAPTLELVRSPARDAQDEDAEQAAAEQAEDDSVKVIGPIRVSITLFNIFLNEADELSRRLGTSLAEWALELNGPVPANCEPLAHALAGNAAAVQFEDLSILARALEHALGRAQRTRRYSEAEAQMFVQAADEIRHLLHQFAAGFLKPLDPTTLAALQAYQPEHDADFESELDSLSMGLDALIKEKGDQAAEPDMAAFADVADDAAEVEEQAAPALAMAEAAIDPLLLTPAAHEDEVEPGLPDAIEPELFDIFDEEAQELLGQLHGALRAWLQAPQDRSQGAACMRALHTFKGGARLSGAMRLGEQAHRLETEVERVLHQHADSGAPSQAELLSLQAGGDALAASMDALRAGHLAAPVAPAEAAPTAFAATTVQPLAAEQVAAFVPAVAETVEALAPIELAGLEPTAVAAEPAAPVERIDWSRFVENPLDENAGELGPIGPQAMVRVRGSLLERMAAQAGEVSIRRTRLESELAQMKSALLDLDDNLERLRAQMRELELQAEAQMGSQQDQLSRASEHFDPLEFDRYTRFQELTKMLTESVGDVATVQRSLQRNVQLGEDELAAQSRLTRELQDDLLRTRMVEFDSLSERMHRVVRQAARDTGKQAQLHIVGGQTELDRSVLERMAGAFEHLLRNSVGHGIEASEARVAAGKDATGQLTLTLQQEGNEVLLSFSDDGAGLDLPRIRQRGEQLGLIKPDAPELSEAELTQLIFTPGFSTASQVTETSGRGVGMDVVRAEVATLGGSIDTHTEPGQGSRFTLRLPLTTALTQVVLLRCGDQTVAVPAALMDSVQRLPLDQLEGAYASGKLNLAGHTQPFFWLGSLLGQSGHGQAHGKTASIVLLRNSQQRLALHVDEVMGNQEVVVKNLGPQLNRVPGLAGISLLASGDVALIYNPHALATCYGEQAQQRLREQQAQLASGAPVALVEEPQEALAPLVLVVDDSLTVRRVTQRLLEREGYRVQLAKDGLDAMECLAAEELPALVLSDIEMPRMDGFDLVRNMRADSRLSSLPVIMITSRIAQKHKDYAAELGVSHYLGKPYDEELLLQLIAGYTSASALGETAPLQH